MSSSDPLAVWLAERLGVTVIRRSPVGGGCIHSAWRLDLAETDSPHHGRLFVKSNHLGALPLLEAEAEGLAALAAATDSNHLQIPQPLALGVAGDQSVLVLPWLDLVGVSRPAGNGRAGWRLLGASLAQLHRRSLHICTSAGDRCHGSFGWERPNFIGSGPQPNGWNPHWGTFFTERRLRPQLERLTVRKGGLRGVRELLELVPRWLEGHGAEPCLVHGDLWYGNVALTAGGTGIIFDPAVYRGDREVDIAMAKLFGGIPSDFFDGYQEAWPLKEGHGNRDPIYNLYHILNHANLFGGPYPQQAQAMINDLLSRDIPA